MNYEQFVFMGREPNLTITMQVFPSLTGSSLTHSREKWLINFSEQVSTLIGVLP